jgi:hypothetical protein
VIAAKSWQRCINRFEPGQGFVSVPYCRDVALSNGQMNRSVDSRAIFYALGMTL